MTWTPKLLAELRETYVLSGARVFARKHGISPGAVCGMASRMGLSKPKAARATRQMAASKTPKRSRPKIQPSSRKRKEPPAPPSIATHATLTCQWIEGDPAKREFCGRPAKITDRRRYPYCPDHCERAYVQPERKL